MQRLIRKSSLRLILCLAILGLYRIAHADDQTPKSTPYRQEVRDRLKRLQSNLDLMFANHQLTADQYQSESERVRQLRVQIHSDAQEDESMTQDDRNTDFGLIRQISEQASQWAIANSSSAPASPTAATTVPVPISNP